MLNNNIWAEVNCLQCFVIVTESRYGVKLGVLWNAARSLGALLTRIHLHLAGKTSSEFCIVLGPATLMFLAPRRSYRNHQPWLLCSWKEPPVNSQTQLKEARLPVSRTHDNLQRSHPQSNL